MKRGLPRFSHFCSVASILLLTQLACTLLCYFLLQDRDQTNLHGTLLDVSSRMTRSFSRQIDSVDYSLRRNAAVLRIHGDYLTARNFSDAVQYKYDPRNGSVEVFAFAPVITHAERSYFESFCQVYVYPDYEIRTYVVQEDGLLAVQRAPERTVYHPVMLADPVYPSVLGIDLGGDPYTAKYFSFMENATLQSTVVSDRVTMDANAGANVTSAGVAMSFPVYLNESQPEKGISGYQFAVIEIAELVSQSIERVQLCEGDVFIYVTDISESTIYTTESILYLPPEIPPDASDEDADTWTTLEVRNRVWKLRYYFSGEYKDSQMAGTATLFAGVLAGMCILLDIMLTAFTLAFAWNKSARLAVEDTRRASQMLSYINHELRNPLNVIKGLVDYTLDELKRVDQVDNRQQYEIMLVHKDTLLTAISDLAAVSGACELLENVCQDSLTLQRLEEGKMNLDPIICKALDVVESLHLIVKSKFEEKKAVQLILECDPTITVRVDTIRLKQIILNFILNSFKYTNSGSVTIKVTQCESAHTTRFAVIDTGIGIRKDKQKNIFQPFASVNKKDVEQHNSFGLGLYLSRMLATRLAGSVGFRSDSSGSEFWVDIPTNISIARSSSSCSTSE